MELERLTGNEFFVLVDESILKVVYHEVLRSKFHEFLTDELVKLDSIHHLLKSQNFQSQKRIDANNVVVLLIVLKDAFLFFAVFIIERRNQES